MAIFHITLSQWATIISMVCYLRFRSLNESGSTILSGVSAHTTNKETTSRNLIEIKLPIRLYGLNYNLRRGPDWDPNRCETIDQVVFDLKLIQQLTNRIRLLSITDCNQAEVVLKAMDKGNLTDMKLWLGLWVNKNETVFETELKAFRNMLDSGLVNPNRVLGITVGSEAILREEVTIDESINNFKEVKKLLLEYGYNSTSMPVAIVDIDKYYTENTKLLDTVDTVMVNAFPFWQHLPITTAVDYLVEQKVPPLFNKALKQNKEYMLGETGWPSGGNDDRASEASVMNQVQYFQDFYCMYDIQNSGKYFYFTTFDPEWRIKQDNKTNSVEGHFGLFYANRTLKEHFRTLSFSCGSETRKIYSFVVDDSPNTSSPSQSPTRSPNAKSNTLAPTKIGTGLPVNGKPVSNNNNSVSALCSAHRACAALAGYCCPNNDMELLECCDNSPTDTLTTFSPTPAMTWATSENVDTKAPTNLPSSSSTTTTPTATATTFLPSPFISEISTTNPSNVRTSNPTSRSTRNENSLPPTAGPTQGDDFSSISNEQSSCRQWVDNFLPTSLKIFLYNSFIIIPVLALVL